MIRRLARYNFGMQHDLEVNPLRAAATKPAMFEGAPLELATDQFIDEEPSLLDAVIAVLRPLTTLVRRQAADR